MSDITCLRTRRHRREWERAIRRFARRAARHMGADLRVSALLPLLVVVAAPGAFALPVGEQVQAGSVTVNRPNATSMTITQGSQKGIVNWNGFSIAGNERVDISQPSAQAVLLNRVVGNEVSRIAGQLNANGQVFLVNPAGVVFARGASVNVGSLVASTLGISNDAFLAGKYHFAQGGAAAGKVSNQGSITAATGGAVALLGAQVDNSGLVSATLGKIAIGAGSDITLDFAGDGLTMLKVNHKVANALIGNSGTLQADGGQIVMSARAADDAAASVLNQTGTVRARSVESRNGRIVLDGGSAGETDIGGSVDVSAPDSGKGGQIDVTGYHVAVSDGARVDASGAGGGGRVRVGGGAAGKAPDIVNADALWMSPNAHVMADALVAGDGGNIVMFGTEAARVYGELSAKGGPGGGNGGLVETSGKYLATDGAQIHVEALRGHGGQWLLDPSSIEIVNTAPSSVSTGTTDSTSCCSLQALSTSLGPALSTTTNPVTFTPGAGDSYVLASDITSQLNRGASVTISTSKDGGGEYNGDITMLKGTSITKTAADNEGTLTLSANGSITVLGTIGGAAGDQRPAGKLNVVLDANTGASGQSNILLSGASISTNGGYLAIGVPQSVAGTPAAAKRFDGAAVGIIDSRIDTTVPQGPTGLASGSVTINGQGTLKVPDTIFGISDTDVGLTKNQAYAPVTISSSSIATSVSDISVSGQAGGDFGAPAGVAIGGTSSLRTSSGNISITGSAPTTKERVQTFTDIYGVALRPASLSPSTALLSTTTGNISITGTGPAMDSAVSSVSGGGVLMAPTARLDQSTTVIRTGSGNVNIIGNGMSIGTAFGGVSGAGVMLRPEFLGSGVGPLVHTGSGNVSISASATTIANLNGGTLSGSGVSIAADGGQGFPFSPSVVSDAGNIFVTGNGASVTGTVSGGTVGGSGIAIGGSSVALSTGGAGSITLNGNGPKVQALNTGSVSGSGVSMVAASVSTNINSISTANAPLVQTQTGRISIDGKGPAVQTVASLSTSTSVSTGIGSVTGDGVSLLRASLSTSAGGIVPVILSASGDVDVHGTGAVVQSSPGRVGGNGVRIIGTSLGTGGAMSITGTGATAGGGSAAVAGAGVYAQNARISSTGADVSITGTSANGKRRYVPAIEGNEEPVHFDGVHLEASDVAASGGRLSIRGTAPDGIAAYGVFVAGMSPALGLHADGAVTIYGLGSGADGVALAGTSSSNRGVVGSANGSIDIRGGTNGQLDANGAHGKGVSLADVTLQANAPAQTVSVTASTPADAATALYMNRATLSAGDYGTIVVRASNSGKYGFVFDDSDSTFSSRFGTVVFVPGKVGADFGIVGDNAQAINVLGASSGLSIGPSMLGAIASNIATVVIGSSTQTGKITVSLPQGFAHDLTLQNTGAGSQGIDLPSGAAMPDRTLALDSSGRITDPGGIKAQTLLLAGGGDFDLADAGNDVKVLALSGAHDVRFATAGGFTIGTASANGFDGATGNLARIGGSQPNVTGDLTAISDGGAIAIGTPGTPGTPGAPTHLSAGGSIDLVMERGVFDNASGGTIGAGNAWRIWAATRNGENRNGVDPGGALPNFYGCVYGGFCSWNGQPSQSVVPADGNHFVYADRPTVTVTIGSQTREQGGANGAFGFDVSGLLAGDRRSTSVVAGRLGSSATTISAAGVYGIDGTFSSPVGYNVVVEPGTLTVTPMQLQGAVFNTSGLQPLFTAQEQSFVYESNLGAVNICVGTNEPILALQQPEGDADALAAEWKRVRSRPNLNNCLVVNGQHGCGEF
ncbi:filamentous hemagglutinin N-terminal domain-containing protein [Caballeronia sp. GAFFF3]|uniref:beta strand repeat-containing protein n=1 Tax=Caballeronia sp. GAFFF3 TaxID=2921759 RepID=UPI002028C38E|nr:filamentous hemagglutinin N-terminal domain-containing protein [Caballeronia sp. GAFFF3]